MAFYRSRKKQDEEPSVSKSFYLYGNSYCGTGGYAGSNTGGSRIRVTNNGCTRLSYTFSKSGNPTCTMKIEAGSTELKSITQSGSGVVSLSSYLTSNITVSVTFKCNNSSTAGVGSASVSFSLS